MSVVSLRGTAVPGSREPDSDVIERLEDLLSEAKAGRIHGLAFVRVVDDVVTTGWSGKANCHYMLSGAARLQWRIAHDFEVLEDK
jgi:hypothetical protein